MIDQFCNENIEIYISYIVYIPPTKILPLFASAAENKSDSDTTVVGMEQ